VTKANRREKKGGEKEGSVNIEERKEVMGVVDGGNSN